MCVVFVVVRKQPNAFACSFSEATRDNEHKRSLVKTPARMSPCVTSSTPLKPTADGGKATNVKTTTFSATKTPGTVWSRWPALLFLSAMMSSSDLSSFSLWLCEGPFVFTGNTSTSATPGTQKKSKFDLKESLSRPLTYKPHTGTEPPFSLLISSRKSSQSVNRLSTVS